MRLGWAAAAILLAACQSVGQRAEEVREGLLGLRARELHNCLGEPIDHGSEGEVEYLSYFWTIVFAPDGRRPLEDWSRAERLEGRYDDIPVGPIRRGSCALVFALREGRVAGAVSEGRNGLGMPWDAGCMMQAKRCLTGRTAD